MLIGVEALRYDKLSNSAFYEKVNILCIFSNTDDAVLKAKADALNITVNSHDEMKKSNMSKCQANLEQLQPDVLFSVNNLKYIRILY